MVLNYGNCVDVWIDYWWIYMDLHDFAIIVLDPAITLKWFQDISSIPIVFCMQYTMKSNMDRLRALRIARCRSDAAREVRGVGVGNLLCLLVLIETDEFMLLPCKWSKSWDLPWNCLNSPIQAIAGTWVKITKTIGVYRMLDQICWQEWIPFTGNFRRNIPADTSSLHPQISGRWD